jgi:hypothetical protein
VNNQKETLFGGWFGGGRRTRIVVCLWAIFAAGLLVQMAAPRLKIENNMFVMPPISSGQQTVLRPDVVVRRERWMQLASGILTVGGALALGFFYRRTLLVAIKG